MRGVFFLASYIIAGDLLFGTSAEDFAVAPSKTQCTIQEMSAIKGNDLLVWHKENDPSCTPTSTGASTSPVSIDPAKERDALRRFDLVVLPQLAILVIIGWLDRANIGESEAN